MFSCSQLLCQARDICLTLEFHSWVQPVFGLISNYCHIPIYPGLSIQIQPNWTLGYFTMPPTPAPLPAFVLIFPMLWILAYHHSWLNLSSWKPNSNNCSLKEPSLVLPHSCTHSFLTTGVLLAFATSVTCSKLSDSWGQWSSPPPSMFILLWLFSS